MKNDLALMIKESGLEQTKANVLLDKFIGYFQIADEWEKKAKEIVVTDADQKVAMQLARVGRLFLREKRINLEKTRKELKEQSLREGKAIDGIANVLKALIVPIEEYLGKQEKFVEIKAAEVAELARVEMERKEEEERLAKEEADRKEQERIRIENEKLKREAEAREKKMQVEREKAEAKEKELEEKARLEREEAESKQRILEEKARKEKVEIERRAQIEKQRQDKILAEQKAEAEAERKRIEEKAKKAEAKQEKKLEVERKEREKIQAKLDEEIECPFCHKKFSLKNEFELCIYCNSTDIDYNKNNDSLWTCNYCGESWI